MLQLQQRVGCQTFHFLEWDMAVIFDSRNKEFYSWESFPGSTPYTSDQVKMAEVICRTLEAIGEPAKLKIQDPPKKYYFLVWLENHHKYLHVDHNGKHTITALQLNGEDATTQALATHLREALINLNQEDFFIAPEPRVLNPNFHQPDLLKIQDRKPRPAKREGVPTTDRKETLGYRGEKHFHKWLVDRGLAEHCRWLNEHEESGQPRDFWVQNRQIEVKTTNGHKVWVDLSEHERREAQQHPDNYFVVVVTLSCHRVDAYQCTQRGFQRMDEDTFLKRLKEIEAPLIPPRVALQEMPSPDQVQMSGAFGKPPQTVFPVKVVPRRAEQVVVQLILGRLHLPLKFR